MEALGNRDSDSGSYEERVRSGNLQCAARLPADDSRSSTTRCDRPAVMTYRGLAAYCEQHQNRVRER